MKKGHTGYKKYIMIALFLSMVIFPDYFFTALLVMLLVAIILVFLVDIVVDVYLIVIFFI